jgi:2'-5' RNA ligase
MAQGVVVFFEDEADAAVRELWARIGVTHRLGPHVTFAAAGSIPPPARAELRADLGLLTLPELWLYHLTVFAEQDNVLVLGAVVDGELLAVHSAVHDVLAGRVRHPQAHYLPGSWVPHCTLAAGLPDAELVAAFGTVHPVTPIRARIRQVAVADTSTGQLDVLLER